MSHSYTLRKSGTGRPRAYLLACLLVGSIHNGSAQLLVDLFDRADDNVVGNGWVETETTAPTSVVVSANQLAMKSNSAGRDFVARPTPGSYNTVLADNTCEMQWSFNLRQTRLDPGGFNAGAYGIAVVLAGSSNEPTEGIGYAVVLGSPGTTVDPLRLVRYTGGLVQNANITTIISAGDFSTEFLDVRVTFDPISGLWNLFYTNNGAGPYGDATEAATLAGAAIDNAHTGADLPFIGCLWNHSSSTTERGRFDNLKVPYECSTRMEFRASADTIGGHAGTFAIPIELANPSATNDAQVEVVLVSGNAARIDNFDVETLTFTGLEVGKFLVITITDDGSCDGDDQLVFELQNPAGGQGVAYVGALSSFALTIIDEEVTPTVVVNEDFETDGSGSRYALNTSETAPSIDSYLVRTTASGFAAMGGLNLTGISGASCFGAENLSPIAPGAEATLTISGIDILGVSNMALSLLVGARNSSHYDQMAAGRDYIFVETNVDGAGWTRVGAFRAKGPLNSTNRQLAVDSDLDGVGDGAPLTGALTNYTFGIGAIGSTMDVRIRFRSTEAGEEMYFDNLRVRGSLCRQVYYSNVNGNAADPIWSHLRSGEVSAITMDRNTSLVIQAGTMVTASGLGTTTRNLTVESGGTLNGSAATIDVYGDHITNNGSFTFGMGQLRILGSDPVTIDGAQPYELYDITVNAPAGVTNTATLNILGTVMLEQGNLNTTFGTVTLRSNEDMTGRLGPVPASASYTGKLKVERYVPEGMTNWRLLGSPVSNVNVANWQDDFYTAGYPGSQTPGFNVGGVPWPSVRWYDETNPGALQNDGLMGVSGSNMPLAPGKGFAAWSGDHLTTTEAFVVDVNGPPNIAYSPITLPMSWTDSGHPAVDGYNLVSNPLPSPIAFEQLTLGEDVDHAYSIFNPVNGNMATWNGTVGLNGANGIIQSSQGFWLKAHGSRVTTTVTESAKVADNGGGVFGGKSDSGPSMLRLQLTSTVNSYSDETVVVFSEGSPEFNGDDVPKYVFAHPLAPQLATQGEMGQWIAINAYGPYVTDITIPVIVDVAVTGTYMVTATEMLNTGLSCLSIEDVVTGTITPLNGGASYSFSANATDDANIPRLLLHATAPLIFAAHDVACAGDTTGWTSLELTSASTDLIWSVDGGALVAEQTAQPAGMSASPLLAAGDYVLTVSSPTGCGALTHFFQIGEPILLELSAQIDSASCPNVSDGGIDVYVQGGVEPYSFQWNDNSTMEDLTAAAGDYSVMIMDANGCAVTSPILTIPSGDSPVATASVANTTVGVNTPIMFINESQVSDSVLWDFADGSTSTAGSPEHSFAMPGSYNVTLTIFIAECSATTTVVMDVETTTGIVTSVGPSLNAWVNGDRIVIEHTIANGLPLLVEILNPNGQLFTQYRLSGYPGRATLPMEGMSSGIWFIRVTNEQKQRTFALPVID